jgi:toxin CptA
VSSRINLTFRPSVSAALLAALPWLVLAAFVLVAGFAGSPWLLLALIPIGWRTVTEVQRLGFLTGPRAIIALKLEPDRHCCLLADGRELNVQIHRNTLLTSSVLALKLDVGGATSDNLFVWVVGPIGPFRANADPQEIRRLRMWLRTGQSATVDTHR